MTKKKDLCLILRMTSITYDKFEGLSPSVWLVFQGPVSKTGKKTRDQTGLNWMKTRPRSQSFQGPGQSGRGLFDILKLRKPPKNRSRLVFLQAFISNVFITDVLYWILALFWALKHKNRITFEVITIKYI